MKLLAAIAVGLLLAACALPLRAQTCTGGAALTWQPPVQHTDGSALKDLTTYRAYWGTTPTSLPSMITIMAPASAASIDQLCAGTWYFAVTALDSANTESALSNVATKAIPGGGGGGGGGGGPPPSPTAAPVVSWAPSPNVIGFDFRGTQAFVSDPAGSTYVLGDRYPTTRAGVTFGWESAISVIDRRNVSPYTPELAGLNYHLFSSSATEAVFRVDLPTPGMRIGIRLAAGDAGDAVLTGANVALFEIRDGTTVLYARTDASNVPAGSFVDAKGTLLTAANWRTSNARADFTFATTTLRLALKRPTHNASVLAYFSIEVLP